MNNPWGIKTLPALLALLTLLAAAGAAALLYFGTPPAAAQTTTDYDTNDNGLIDISTIDQLNAMRWDLDGDGAPTSTATSSYRLAFPNRDTATSTLMGCPAGSCNGYELTADLAFAATSSWTPINSFSSTLDGAGHTITGININVTTAVNAAFIGDLIGNAVVRDLGLINLSATSTATTAQNNGILAGFVAGNVVISGVYAEGGSLHVSTNVSNARNGGLVGNSHGNITASYSTAAVTVTGNNANRYAGGLVGQCYGCYITASYAAGPVTSTQAALNNIGGLTGRSENNDRFPVVTDSYCDTQATGLSDCDGNSISSVTVTGYTTAGLQSPTDYTGIYAGWNVDLDGDSRADAPWDFGGSSEYPVLRSPAQRLLIAPGDNDYDLDDNGLIDVRTVAQLHAMRWDLDGDGAPLSHTSSYAVAFPNRNTTSSELMGCPMGACAGYELADDLAFAATSTWAPIVNWATTLDGGGHTITGVNINISSGDAGLFGSLTADAVIRDLGLLDFSVTSTRVSAGSNGILAGYNPSGARATISNVYAQGGRIAISSDVSGANVGGLVGIFSGDLTASYANVTVSMTGSNTSRHAGGLVGRCLSCTITASYAAGTVTSAAALTNIGGLVGNIDQAASAVTDSYCDTEGTGQSDCDGNATNSATATAAGYTTAELQAPTGYTGIYATWNVDLDGDDLGDHSWTFGGGSDYPTLRTPMQRAAVAAPPPADYDANDNNLIEIANMNQLNAMRWDLDGDGDPDANAAAYNTAFPGRTTSTPGRSGCPGTCAGYELAADLTAATGTAGYDPWRPIASFATTLDGAGHTITGVNVNITTVADAAFLGDLTATAVIRDLGLINFNMTSTSPQARSNGILSGFVAAGAEISNVYAAGGSITLSTNVNSANVGGLVGNFRGTITASYSTAAVTVTGADIGRYAGGLAARCIGCTITASYAAGPVTTTAALSNLGGLTGSVENAASVITNSYCDTEGTGQADCDGNVASGVAASAAGHTTAQMQTPTGYTGIYTHWNLDPDGNGHPNYPWKFGTATDYPTLNTPAQRISATPGPTDYDANDNNLIDVSNIAQLHAMRWDLDGDGDPDAAADALPYTTAFGGRTTSTPGRMGCPATCAGYELAANLTFPTATTSAYNPWTPIVDFNTAFNGRSRTISGVNVNVTTALDGGLFGSLAASSTVQDLGLINVSVTSTSPGAQDNGTLAGTVAAGAVVTAVYADGGRVAVSVNGSDGGGLVGELYGELRAAWSTAAVTAGGSPTNLYAGGLVGRRNGGTISASYAAGSVSTTTANATAGGLVGISLGAGGGINQSYCDTGATGQADCIGVQSGASVAAAGYDTATLQAPTDYAGTIYALWNLDLDGDFFPDYPWRFGTSSEYPMLNTPAQRLAAVPEPTDYDTNDNGLIDVSSIAHLDALRYDLNGDGVPEISTSTYNAIFPGRSAATTTRMGCPMGECAGYELMASLTFPSETSSPYNPWTPIGGDAAPFNTTFDGVGRTLTGMNVTGTIPRAGLFGTTGASSTIRDLGMINATVNAGGDAHSGIIAGQNAGRITASYASGGSVRAAVTAARAGGLVGSDNAGIIIASYSTATVNITSGATVIAGGLVGGLYGSQVIASYAAGPVSGTAGAGNVGGFAGFAQGTSTRITDSYCDSGVTTRNDCIGASSTVQRANLSAQTSTAAALQAPTGYTGPYVNWNVDLDDNGSSDYPWNFGTSSQYPMLNRPAQRLALAPDPVDYDANDNNLIDIDSIVKLNAIRYDLDGDGDPLRASRGAYNTAFPGRVVDVSGRMGCPATCVGYELTMSMSFPSETSSDYNPWTPIAAYAAEFNGQGYTLTGLRIETSSGDSGLFSRLNSGGLIKDLGLINPAVTSTANIVNTGALAGRVSAGANIDTSYVSGGSVAASGVSAAVGGLVGRNEGRIRAGYSTAAIANPGNPANARIGGLVGSSIAGEIVASYAAGLVTPSTDGGTNAGGLLGRSDGATDTITDSFCDTTATGQTNCVGFTTNGSTATAQGYLPAALQAPTGYEGPYVHWNLDLDASGRPDYLWDFGTTSQYPTLHAPADRPPLPPLMDYDTNNNDLIDIDNLAQLNAIRWDLDGDGAPDASGTRPGYDTAFPGRTTSSTGRMGCPNTCAGYELTLSLTFPAETSSSYNPWTPIDEYAGDFDGRGRTLTNMNVATEDYAGLFGRLNSGGLIRDVGMINPIVTLQGDGTRGVGGLVGTVRSGGQIDTSYVAGGRITLTGGSNRGGGLVGQSAGLIRASYASAEVRTDAARNGVAIGGLVGRLSGGLVASYAHGAVSASGTNINVGGLVGRSTGSNSAITDSYCDTEATGQTACVGPQSGNAVSAQGYLPAALQSPTGYTGIYLNWNLDLDNDLNLDYPWNFGRASEYPRLYTPEQRARQIPASRDYDDNDNNLIDIRTLDELNAIRWDTDGDGHPEAANFSAYGTVFAGRTATATGRMGCPAGCTGYELRESLTFPAEGPYANWTGINNFAAIFDGQGHTLTGLTVNSASVQGGLFRHVQSGGHIKNLGIIEPDIRISNPATAGGLAGTLHAGARIDTSYVAGGRIVVTYNNAEAGGLVGSNRQGIIRASYATATVTTEGTPRGVDVGGLVGWNLGGAITASYAAGIVGGHIHADNDYGGLVGNASRRQATNAPVNITLSYCDSEISPQTGSNCIGYTGSNAGTIDVAATTTAVLQAPDDYTGIYADWNLDLSLPADGTPDNPWQFARGSYPRLWHEGRATTDSPPPGGPRVAQPPQDTPYNPASDHPEVYENDRYEMSASCDVQRNADGEPVGSTITFDLGNYRGQVILHLAQWNGEYFTSYESLGIAMPTFERDGQTATVRVTTDPTQTRFLLDSISPTTNLVLGYADCHTDDATGVLVTPGAAAPATPPAETATTSTPADAADPAETAETSTPPAPKIYTNDRYEMTASCDVRHNAEGEPESSLITFDLGRYEGRVILSISLWNGEYYASLESHDLTPPTLERDGQSATVLVTTNPAETRFLLDGTPNGLRMNLLLGYADCHTAGE